MKLSQESIEEAIDRIDYATGILSTAEEALTLDNWNPHMTNGEVKEWKSESHTLLIKDIWEAVNKLHEVKCGLHLLLAIQNKKGSHGNI